MEVCLLVKAFGFFLLIIIGIPGNIFILLKFTYIKMVERKLLPANVILTVLALSNLIVIFSRVTPQALSAIEIENFLDDTNCKLVLFTYRVSRAMSVCITSFLSCHQCVHVAPFTKYWVFLKESLAHRQYIIMILLLGMNIPLYSSAILYGRARVNSTRSPYTLRLVYCDADFLSYVSFMLNGLVSVIREIIFVGLMALSSIYMVTILYAHGNTMKGMRSLNKGKRKRMEYQASRAVILLVALYVMLYGMDNSMWIYTLTLSSVNADTNDIRIFLAASYAALSPILIIATNPKLNRSIKNPWIKKISKIDKQGIHTMTFVNSIS